MQKKKEVSKLNSIEQEIIFLRATYDAINNMANHEVLILSGDSEASTVHFKSMTHRRYFNLILVDFLSKTDPKGKVSHKSFLEALRGICGNPLLNSDGSILDLSKAVEKFVGWLNEEIDVDTWLAAISLQVKIKIRRYEYLKICGDLSKHNFLRAISVADRLVEILERSGEKISQNMALSSFEDFDTRFHQDIFVYHTTLVVSFLNDIRWGIYDYIRPLLENSIKRKSGEPIEFSFEYPSEVGDKFARESFCDLMNYVRNEPYFPRFKPWKYVAHEY